ncbi:MAG: exopolysaccharide biosynthesis protein [Desulfitobacterium hafniense]|nr:exopolysaccharide biosynthesis protein [Desulfitobacterium hafniense]
MADTHKIKDNSFATVLSDLAQAVPPEGLTTGELLKRLGNEGFLILCMVFTIPFLLPVSIPGSSTPFGLAIALIGFGLSTGQKPWLPSFILNRKIDAHSLKQILDRGSIIFLRIEKLLHVRLSELTKSKSMVRANYVALTVSAILLMFPLPLPFSNTVPAYGVLFLAVGSLERDGIMIILGYLLIIIAITYFTGVALVGSIGFRILFN